MADYIWTRTGKVAGYDAVAGEDVPAEVEALPSRALQRMLDRGYISLKADVPEVDTSALATDAELAAAQATDDARLDALEARGTQIWLPPSAFTVDTGSPALAKTTFNSQIGWYLDAAASEAVSTTIRKPEGWASFTSKALIAGIGSGASGSIKLQVRTFERTATLAASAGGMTTTYDTVAISGAGVVEHTGPTKALHADTVYIVIQVLREGGNVSDNLAEDVSFHGFLLTKAS